MSDARLALLQSFVVGDVDDHRRDANNVVADLDGIKAREPVAPLPGIEAISRVTSTFRTASPWSSTDRYTGSSVGHNKGATSSTVRPIWSSSLPPFTAASIGLRRMIRILVDETESDSGGRLERREKGERLGGGLVRPADGLFVALAVGSLGVGAARYPSFVVLRRAGQQVGRRGFAAASVGLGLVQPGIGV